MEQRIKVTISDQQIKGTILDPLRINARVLAALGSGSGMNGAFTDITYTPHSPTLNIAAIDSDKVKWTVNTGAGETVYYLGTATAGTFKLLWISLVHPSTVTFKSTALGSNGIFQTGLMVGVTEIEYTRTLSADYLFMCECLGGNQWLLTEVGGLANTAIGWQNALLDYVEKETGKSLVADTEIAKIHSQNTDQYLDFGGANELYVEELWNTNQSRHDKNGDQYVDFGSDYQTSSAELRGVVDFANIATPPTAYQIPFVQDVAGVKSLKYSADFVFENGTLKVKGAGNTTGKTLSLFNSSNAEILTVLDSGKVGIGTTTPGSFLSIQEKDANTPAVIEFKDTDAIVYGKIGMASNINIIAAGTSNTDIVICGMHATLANIRMATNSIVRMSVLSNGNVGIGTTTPAKSLEVSHATGDCFRLSYDKSTTYKADFTLNSAGKLTIAAAGGHEFTGDVNLTGVLKIDGVQVVKEQQAAVIDIKENYIDTDMDTADNIAQAVNDVAMMTNDILGILRTHGLIAT